MSVPSRKPGADPEESGNAWCPICREVVELRRIRDWPELGMPVGECPNCANTLTVSPGDARPPPSE